MYARSRSNATDSIDVARLELFTRKQRSNDSIPPTQAALIQHIKRAAYQAGFIWGQATIYVEWKPTALRTGVGRSKMACGKSFGQHFRQLLRVANSLRSVATRRNAVADTSDIALVFLAQLCVVAIATAKIYSQFDLTR